MKIFCTTFILLCFAFVVSGQSISGKIQDPSGKAIEYTTVALKNASDSLLSRGAITDMDGNFEMGGVEAGNYFIECSYIGYETFYSEVIQYTGGDLVLQPYKLKTSSQVLNEVTVTARKPLIEIRADKMILNTDASVSAIGTNALELLKKAPGVVIDNNDNIQLKGKNGVRIYIDGKPSYFSAQELANFLKGIASSDIEAVEIITNPSAKYDAQGNAGIINLRLKKNKNFGTNGSANLSLGYGVFHKSFLSLNLNNRVNKWNTYGNIGIGNSKYDNEMNLYREQDGKIFDQNQSQVSSNRPVNAKIGVDYAINSKHTLGALVSGNTQYIDNEWASESQTTIGTMGRENMIDSVLIAQNNITSNNLYTNFNVNYKFSDTVGNELTIDLDKGIYRGESASFQPNYYKTSPTGTTLSERIFSNSTPSDIDINTGKLDYSKTLQKSGLVLSTGVKYANVKSDNTFLFYNVVNDIEVKDPSQSNDFGYTENVAAIYGNINGKASEKLNFQAGIRYEHTTSTGNLTRDASEPTKPQDYVKRKYGNFFPSGALTYTLNPNHVLNLTYSRRIQRPDYESLNPFEWKLDELTFRKGNPFLTPQYNDNIELTYTVKQAANISIGYSKSQDVISDVIERDKDVANKTFINYRNIANSENYSLSINTPLPIAKWWNGFLSTTMYQTKFEARFDDYSFDTKTPIAVNVYAENTFNLPKDIGFEVSGWFNSSSIEGGSMITRPQGQLDLGVKRSFMDKKVSVKLGFTDVLHTARWSGESNVIPGLYFRGGGRWEARRVNLNINYRFGSNQVKGARNRKTGLEDEAGRLNN